MIQIQNKDGEIENIDLTAFDPKTLINFCLSLGKKEEHGNEDIRS
jgi:hypothetical protein